eukprot:COSAG05_NODE_1558_length_4564_cov_5.087794_5_plen_57_part_00
MRLSAYEVVVVCWGGEGWCGDEPIFCFYMPNLILCIYSTGDGKARRTAKVTSLFVH